MLHIGDEAATFADTLSGMGVELGFCTFVPEREREFEEAVRQAFGRSDLLVITGGRARHSAAAHGNDLDDFGKKTLSRLLDRRLVLQDEVLRKVEAVCRARRVENTSPFEKLALLPQGARPLDGPDGMPSGFQLEADGRQILYVPGTPGDFAAGLAIELSGLLMEGERGRRVGRSGLVRTYGLNEARVAELLGDLGVKDSGWTLRSSQEGVDVTVTSGARTPEKAEALLDEAVKAAVARLGDYCYGTGSEGLEDAVARLLTGKKATIATAESCTGGLLAKRLTDVPGSSAYMDRGVVTYSNLAKQELLGVPEHILASHGAVSKETAQAMAEGIRWNAKSVVGVSITGIAGPTGGTPTKPVGLVYIGLATPGGVTVKGFTFPGDRDAVRFATSQKALDLVRRYLIS
ncbi:MAG: nicotinamide-nucleotide amidohydrolase family protein [Nitrospirae bacterium]|nr:nicotinamide-nucleotide amidohydrolase family protein [Nitrospirota bacterium]